MSKTIAIDIRHTYGNKTGKGWYTYHLVKALFEIDKKNQYLLYTKEENPPFELPKNAKLVVIKSPSLVWHLSVLRSIKKLKPDIFWAPTSYIVPANIPDHTRSIITIHDLVALLFPGNHNKKAIYIEKATLEKAAQKADHIFAVSQHTAKDVVKKFNIPAKKISITPCAADIRFEVIPDEDAKNTLKNLKVPNKFILGVGTLEPRKNLISLIRAFNKISTTNKSVHLVIAGGEGWKFKEIYEEAGDNPKIHFLGYVSQNELLALYNRAMMFVFPSLYEGFGIPPLEAMQCGCPVISSNTSSLPEVVGKAALLVDPKSVDDIAEKIESLIKNPELRCELGRSSIYQAKKFSWSATARHILDVFNKAFIIKP